MDQQSSSRKVKFLTAIWGKRYVEEFAQVSLPSFMSPGNLPALAQDGNLEILIMTTSESRRFFDEQPLFAKLRNVAPVRFIEIDDLIANGNYGVTLTYAFARGIMDSGDEQTNTTFVFMNSDFVLSEGSLAHLRGLILAGHPCVMSASLRARAEAVYPILKDAVDPATGVLTMSSREMVGHAMAALHPTVIGKTITQSFVGCTTYNQIYWQVDKDTLLGRYHLIFMLAISPEVPLTTINSYCDYGFVPEMVPSGRHHVIGDSDDFFMLELQPTAQERDFLICGRTPDADVAATLQRWTTREHRAFAQFDTVFHTKDLPPGLAATRRAAASYISQLHARMRAPVSHVDHYYWVSGLEAWQSTLIALARTEESQPETAAVEVPIASSVSSTETVKVPIAEARRFPRLPPLKAWPSRAAMGILGTARRATGRRPHVARWHSLHLDFALAFSWAKRAAADGNGRTLVIGDPLDPLVTTLARLSRGEMRSSIQADGKRIYRNILIHVFRKDIREVGPQIQRALDLIAERGTLAVFVEHSDAETDASNFSAELATYAADILPADWLSLDMEVRLVGGYMKRWLRKAERGVLPFVIPLSRKRLPLSVIAVTAWPLIAASTFANNVYQRWVGWRRPTGRPQFASAALILLRRRAGSAEACSIEKVALPAGEHQTALGRFGKVAG